MRGGDPGAAAGRFRAGTGRVAGGGDRNRRSAPPSPRESGPGPTRGTGRNRRHGGRCHGDPHPAGERGRGGRVGGSRLGHDAGRGAKRPERSRRGHPAGRVGAGPGRHRPVDLAAVERERRRRNGRRAERRSAREFTSAGAVG
ncbi:MAG: hypothetical protein D6766_09520 [Verrucomicrobia bacterium]|nr:MAG: hypothetical protein D6766_09520 [Verrucomicrobiota bacterium]